ncbi:kinase-like protein [Serendipita vermifera]|nr:kinase-like protein [Serendipita vermifera]
MPRSTSSSTINGFTTATTNNTPDTSLALTESSALATRSSWLPILESSHQLVLYNPISHALTIAPTLRPPIPVSRNGLLVRSSSREPEEAGFVDDRQQRGLVKREIPGAPQRGYGGTLGISPERAGKVSLAAAAAAAAAHTQGVSACPWCSRPFNLEGGSNLSSEHQRRGMGEEFLRRAPNYFQLLEASFEAQSRPSSPPLIQPIASSVSIDIQSPRETTYPFVETPLASPGNQSQFKIEERDASTSRTDKRQFEESMPGTPRRRFGDDSMAQGYFAAFFKEERRLGMGANGTVYLCQHVLDGNHLGRFAVKKIAVGHSHEYLLKILREVRLLESLRHPNIITYHHSWLESTRFSSFGPSIPTLHVLMEWAEGGSLDDLIEARLGKGRPTVDPLVGVVENEEDMETPTKSARIRAFKAAKSSHANGSAGKTRRSSVNAPGVLLLSAEEIKSFLSDIVSGLAFLHERSILHLDLKLGNVLLAKEEERLIPRAMLSDFGTSQDALQGPRLRSGNTGTVEYSAPEALARDQTGSLFQVDAKSDMWSLGMILHKLIFFRLPYPDIDPTDVNGIEREVLAYPGWKANPDVMAACKRRGLPRAILLLLEGLLNTTPRERPSSERVLHALKEGTYEHSRAKRSDAGVLSLLRRRSSSQEKNGAPTVRTEKIVLRRQSDPPPSTFGNGDYQPPSPIMRRLPSPQRAYVRESLLRSLLPYSIWAYAHIPRTRWRTLRTILLIAKIISLSNVCRHAYPVLWIQALAITLAVADVWQEDNESGVGDLKLSVGLMCVHVLLLSLIRGWKDNLCRLP